MPQPLVSGDKRAASPWIAIHRRHCRQCALLPPWVCGGYPGRL